MIGPCDDPWPIAGYCIGGPRCGQEIRASIGTALVPSIVVRDLIEAIGFHEPRDGADYRRHVYHFLDGVWYHQGAI